MGEVQRLFEPLAEWQMQRLPQRCEGYTLDLDSTVFERYGQQEGSLKEHNPGDRASAMNSCRPVDALPLHGRKNSDMIRPR